MLTLLVAGAIAALAGRMRGGSLETLAATRLEWLALLWVALALQIVPALWLDLSDAAALAVVAASNLILITWLLLNRGLPGVGWMAAGLLLNLIVITANGAMPVSHTAAEIAGVDRSPTAAELKHEPMNASTLLPWLGDVIPLPRLGEVLSIGDLVLVAGIVRLVYCRMVANAPIPGR